MLDGAQVVDASMEFLLHGNAFLRCRKRERSLIGFACSFIIAHFLVSIAKIDGDERCVIIVPVEAERLLVGEDGTTGTMFPRLLVCIVELIVHRMEAADGFGELLELVLGTLAFFFAGQYCRLKVKIFLIDSFFCSCFSRLGFVGSFFGSRLSRRVFVRRFFGSCLICLGFAGSFFSSCLSLIDFVRSFFSSCLSRRVFVSSFFGICLSRLGFVDSFFGICLSLIDFVDSFFGSCLSLIDFVDSFFSSCLSRLDFVGRLFGSRLSLIDFVGSFFSSRLDCVNFVSCRLVGSGFVGFLRFRLAAYTGRSCKTFLLQQASVVKGDAQGGCKYEDEDDCIMRCRQKG